MKRNHAPFGAVWWRFNSSQLDFMKQCVRCELIKELIDFRKNRNKSDGLQSICKACSSDSDKRCYRSGSTRRDKVRAKNERMRTAAKAHVGQYLLTHPCIDCGEGDPIVLDFDHVRDIKRANVADGVARGWSIVSLDAEITKCEVRCANCHRRVTHQRRHAVASQA